MINATEIKLLMALLQQIDKYGIDVFNSLIQKMEHDDPIIDLSSLRKTAANSTKLSHAHNIWEEKTHLLMKAQSDEKLDKIKNCLDIINNKQPFKKLSGLQDFLINLEMIKKKFKSRAEAIYFLTEYLTKVDNKTIESIYTSLEEVAQNDDRSLKAWSSVIFKEKK